MPVQPCQENGNPGFRWGEAGKCYTYTSGDEASREHAKELAMEQGRAIEANKNELILHKAQLPPKENYDLAMAWGWAGPFLKSGVVVEPKFTGQLVMLGKEVNGENLGVAGNNVVVTIDAEDPEFVGVNYANVFAEIPEDVIVEGVLTRKRGLVLYDLTHKDGSLKEVPFGRRREMLEYIFRRSLAKNDKVMLAPQVEISTFEGLEKAYEVFCGLNGVNGIVVKALAATYKEGRGTNVVKVERDVGVKIMEKEEEKEEKEEKPSNDLPEEPVENACGSKGKDKKKTTKSVQTKPAKLTKVDVKLLKAMDMGGQEERIVYGVALIPGLEDSQGDIVTEEAIKQTAYDYMINAQNLKIQHTGPYRNDAIHLVESYIAPADMEIAGQNVPKGSWVIAVYIEDDEAWEAVKARKLTGFSIGGFGEREAA